MFRILYMNVNIFENNELFEKAMSLIPQKRKEKIKQFQNMLPARLSLGAGVLFRLMLEENGLINELEKTRYDQYGKPYLDKEDFYFNLSHSGNYAICIYGDKPVGIDLQKIKSEIPKHTKRILSEEEKQYLASLSENDQKIAFYRLWARKESLIKWDGRGLRIPLVNISAIMEQTVFEENSLYFQEFNILFPEYIISICSEMDRNKVQIQDITSNFLTKY